MIERYQGALRPTFNNDGQWVSYGQHEQRMRDLLQALRLVVHAKGKPLDGTDWETVENTYYNYFDEIPGMEGGVI